MTEDPLDRLVDAVHRAHDPKTQAIDRLGEAVRSVFSLAESVDEALAEAERPGGNQELALRLADRVAAGRALRQQAEARYDVPGLYDRLMARGGSLSARVWS